MSDRGSCERRVYRLATLLTGNPNLATRVIEQVIESQPDLSRMDGAHMDRLTVLRSREIEPGILIDDSIPIEMGKALAGLTSQQREAWVLAVVYEMETREAARAMDCSVTALELHLSLGREVMEAVSAKGQNAAKMLLSYSMSLDVPQFYRKAQFTRRHWRIAMYILAAMAIAAMIVAGLLLIFQSGDPAAGSL